MDDTAELPIAVAPPPPKIGPAHDALALLTPKALSELTGYSISALAKARMYGSGPAFVKLGARKVGYRREAVEAWMRSLERRSTIEGRE